MSNNNTYLQMQQSNIGIADLLSKINEVLSGEELDALTLKEDLTFAPAASPTAGKLRFDGNGMQFSNDNGVTWNNVSSLDYSWKQGVTYNEGDVVLHGSAWWGCTATTSSEPSTSAVAWRLITLGSEIVFVHTMDQFQEALESETRCTIWLSGSMTGTLSATIATDAITIYSDETNSLTFSDNAMAINVPAGRNVYWHCKNTLLAGASAALAITNSGSGGLWLEHVSTAITGINLTGAVNYQEITGLHTGGTQRYWTVPDVFGQMVPKDITQFISATLVDSAALYTYVGGAPGYVTAGGLCENIAGRTAKYWHIDAQGLVTDLPAYADEGYIYFATDTGDVYRYGASAWDPPVHLQGPAGSPGSSGASGSDGVSPEVTLTAVQGGTMVVITDAEHPAGQLFVVSNGETPVFSVGSVTTLPAGSSATVLLSSSGSSRIFDFGIPKGSDGAGSWGSISGTLSNQTDLMSALNSKQNSIDATHKLDYGLLSNTPTIGSAEVTIVQGGVSKGSFNVNATAPISINIDSGGGISTITWGGISGTLSDQTDLNTALGSKQNVIDASHKLDYDYLSNTPTIGSGTVTLTQGGVSKGQINVNATGDSTIELEAGGAAIRPIISSATTALAVSLDNVYDWTVPVSSAGTMTLTSRPAGYEGYVTAMIRLGASATVTFASMTVIDPLAGDCLNYCGVHWDGNTARVYVYDRAPEITILQDTISITGEPNTAITSVDLTSSVSVGAGVTPTFTASSLPSGITLTSAGVLSGTPTAQYTGSSTVTVRATGAEAKTMTLAFSIMPPQPKMVVTARGAQTALVGDYVLQSGSSSGIDSIWYNSGISKYLYTFTGTWCVASSTDTAPGLADAIIDTRMSPDEWSGVSDTNYYYSFTYSAP